MDPLAPKVESFLILATVTDQALANKLSAALEDAKIPVIVEHIEIRDEDTVGVGYRILAPAQFRETAGRLIDIAMTLHQTRNLVTTRPEHIVT